MKVGRLYYGVSLYVLMFSHQWCVSFVTWNVFVLYQCIIVPLYHCTTVFTCAISILCYPCVTFIILYYFLRPRLKLLKFLLYIYHGRLALMGIYASLTACHLTYIYCIFFLCYTYCFKWQINFSLSLGFYYWHFYYFESGFRSLLNSAVMVYSFISAVHDFRIWICQFFTPNFFFQGSQIQSQSNSCDNNCNIGGHFV